jgi:hypothetical protein
MKTAELTSAALDWAVAKCERLDVSVLGDSVLLWIGKDSNIDYEPSINWAQGGPIIEREGIALIPGWTAERPGFSADGPTPLIAAMRCYVASKRGDEIDIPTELMEGK